MTKPTMQDVRGALEASGLPVVRSGYYLRFPNSPLTFWMNSKYEVVVLYCGDYVEEYISETDKNIFAIAAIFGIRQSKSKLGVDDRRRACSQKTLKMF